MRGITKVCLVTVAATFLELVRMCISFAFLGWFLDWGMLCASQLRVQSLIGARRVQ